MQKQDCHPAVNPEQLKQLPKFHSFNETKGYLAYKSLDLPHFQSTPHRQECLVLDRYKRLPIARKNSIYELFYDVPKQQQSNWGILTIDFQNRTSVPNKARKIMHKATPSRSTKQQQSNKHIQPVTRTHRQSYSPLVTSILNQKQLTARKKVIETTMHNIAYERERFKEAIKKDKQAFKKMKQKAQEENYANALTLHQRIRIIKHNKRNTRMMMVMPESSLKSIAKQQEDKLYDVPIAPIQPKKGRRKRSKYMEFLDYSDVRPWTNNLQDESVQ